LLRSLSAGTRPYGTIVRAPRWQRLAWLAWAAGILLAASLAAFLVATPSAAFAIGA
jgi:hypothetical protein